ncbi:MAG: hypothetical protein HYZ49_18090 [Chloroflexi bacterium]|nr:hypothetical protein [Chloroflexota bacterium]
MMKETVVTLGNSKSLVGILTDPLQKRDGLPAVVILNAGLIHRVGPNRLYVKLARALAGLGFVVLRFDLSGIGDSNPRSDHLTFDKSSMEESQEAMNFLTQARGVKHFLFMGHCSGAINSYRIATLDSRVIGAALINIEGVGEAWKEFDRKRKLAQYYQNYYGKGALTSREKWIKLFTGKADYGSIARNVFQNIIWNRVSALGFRLKGLFARPAQPEQAAPEENAAADMRALLKRGARLLFIHPEGSTGHEFVRATLGPVYDEFRASDNFKVELIPQCDHLFTLLANQQQVLGVIQKWAQRQIAPA